MLYLDHNATTFLDPKVKDLMFNLVEEGLNPSSIHAQGRFAKKIIEDARYQIAESMGVGLNSKEYDIIFTSSGTESNNLLLKNYYNGDIFISNIEHLSIFNHLKYAPHIKIIKVDNNGIVDLNHLEELLINSDNAKKLISVMLANNESGVIQDIKSISKLANKYGAKLHSDCMQAIGKITVNIKDLELDYCTISGHKIGAGQGSSALIFKAQDRLFPLIIGGGQEKNIRSGTENVPAIACFGLACRIVTASIDKRFIKMKMLQRILEKNLEKHSKVNIISKNAPRLPNTTLFTVANTDAQIKLIAFDLQGICVSSGSACSSGKVVRSHVLAAMGIDRIEADSSIRVSIAHSQTEQDIQIFIKTFEEIYKEYDKK